MWVNSANFNVFVRMAREIEKMINRKIINWVQCLNRNRALTVPDTAPNGIEFSVVKARCLNLALLYANYKRHRLVGRGIDRLLRYKTSLPRFTYHCFGLIYRIYKFLDVFICIYRVIYSNKCSWPGCSEVG